MVNKTLTTHVQHLIQSLVQQGVQHFIVSPGSRSTPLALLLAEYSRHVNSSVEVHIAVDERDAAFLALGLAKTQQAPVALLATSGTATANYLPALAEARLSHVPLIVLTTDRPQELQQVGAPQTMQQVGMYGDHVKAAMQLTMQDDHADVSAYIDYQVQQLVHQAVTQPAGPVQINLPLRKPLMPDLGTEWPDVQVQTFLSGTTHTDVAALMPVLTNKQVIILAGPAETAWQTERFAALAEKWQVPVIADVLSGVRGQANMIAGIDALLAADAISTDMVPDVVIRFGGTPVSGRLLPWLHTADVLEIQVGTQHVGHDHSRHTTMNIVGDDMTILQDLLTMDIVGDKRFLADWQATQMRLSAVQEPSPLTEMSVAQALSKLPVDAQLFLANSMVIRDFDNYWQPSVSVATMANRGANGIDGTIASVVGMALNGQPTWLPIGDLTLFHDMNGLMLARQNNIDLTLVVTNNNGGGIFSFLPQSQADDYFEEMFGTGQDLDIAKIAALYDAEYHLVTDMTDLTRLVNTQWHGLRLIEIQTDREENVVAHSERIRSLQEAHHE
jgi:2-succinyl-5-enolpyruvyl-6-hydroxy-3-cyclohexene-1-carboxylate synthase